jgi:hypothetical protein
MSDSWREAADLVAEVLEADVGIYAGDSFQAIYDALRRDCGSEDELPDEMEAGLLVFGDNDGRIPDHLKARFRHLDRTLTDICIGEEN